MLKSGDIVINKGELGKVISDRDAGFRFLPMNYGCYYLNELEIIDEDTVNSTSFEEKLEYIKGVFHWGIVLNVHTVSNFQIIEANREGKSQFYVYIDFNETNHSYGSLDEALVGAICRKYDGINSNASYYIYRMLDLGKEN